MVNRRRLLGSGAAALGALGLATQATAQVPRAPRPLTAATTEGPYYLDGMPVRGDITEGLPGVPLEVRFVVLDAAGTPQANSRVDLWQCDAQGLYSGFAGQGDDRTVTTVGKTFLRGTLVAGADGAVSFRSLYPGWYGGRTTHLHFKVWNGPRAVLTSQFFLPDALSEFLYTSLTPYRRQKLRDVLNSHDGIALRAGATVIGAVREEGDRYVASLTTVIDPAANPTVHRPGMAPPDGQRGRGGPPPGFGGTPPLPTLQGEARVQGLVPGPRAK